MHTIGLLKHRLSAKTSHCMKQVKQENKSEYLRTRNTHTYPHVRVY